MGVCFFKRRARQADRVAPRLFAPQDEGGKRGRERTKEESILLWEAGGEHTNGREKGQVGIRTENWTHLFYFILNPGRLRAAAPGFF